MSVKAIDEEEEVGVEELECNQLSPEKNVVLGLRKNDEDVRLQVKSAWK
jgi:hypothetical protein